MQYAENIRRALRVTAALGTALLAIGCNTDANKNQSSSSTHWVTCKADVGCVGLTGAIGCSDEYCVDRDDKRVKIRESSSAVQSTTNAQKGSCGAADFEPAYRLEYDAQNDDGGRVVVIVPAIDFSYETFRLFLAEQDGPLVERRVLEVSRSRSGPTDVQFLIDGVSVSVHFDITWDLLSSTPTSRGATLTFGDREVSFPSLNEWTDIPPIPDLDYRCVAGAGGGSISGEGPKPPTPEQCSQLARIGVCWDGPTLPLPSEPASNEVDTTGRVSEIGNHIAGGCPFSTSFRFGNAEDDEDDAALGEFHWLRLNEENAEPRLLSVRIPGFDWEVQSPQELKFRGVEQENGSFAPGNYFLEVRSQDDELLLWVGQAGSVKELRSPDEISLSDGTAECSKADDCIERWQQRDLPISVGDKNATVPYGGSVQLGDYTAVNGAVDVQTGASLCDDAFVGTALVAVFKTPSRSCAPPAEGVGYIPALFGCSPNCVDGTTAFGTECGCGCYNEAESTKICESPKAAGSCDNADAKNEARYYFDAASETCEVFMYSGCGGNWNNFGSEAACEEGCLKRSAPASE